MASLRGFCARTLLLAALVLGTASAGVFRPEKGHSGQSQLRVQAANKAADSSYGTPACTSGTPQFPNYVPPMKIDPSRMLGKWYYYMDWFKNFGTRTTVNLVTTWTSLLNGSAMTLYPGSNTQAIALEQLYGSVDTVKNDNNQCNTASPASYLYYLTVDGNLRGIGFSDGSADIDGSSVVSTDYDNYAIIFECQTYDTNSGICFEPYLYVHVRERLDKISDSMANTIASAVNQALGSYCLTADMFRKALWMSDKPECLLVGVTDACYVSIRNAYRYLADPTFNG